MCFVDLDPCEVWEERDRKARKEHTCSCCRRTIRIGEVYTIHFSVFEGNPTSAKMCAECKADRHTFAAAHDGILPQPDFFKEMVADCIAEDDEGSERWKEMLARIKTRKSECDKKEGGR